MGSRRRATKRPMWKRRHSELTARGRQSRGLSIEVLQRMRKKGYTLTRAARDLGASRRTVIRHVGSALVKKNGRYIVGKRDRVPRLMVIYERGEQKVIEVPDFETASKIGRYHEIVRRYLESGDKRILREAEATKHIRDVHRRLHTLELKPESLYRLAARKAEPEFFQIYHQ